MLSAAARERAADAQGQLLGFVLRERAALAQPVERAIHGRIELLCGHGLMHQAAARSFRRVENLAGDETGGARARAPMAAITYGDITAGTSPSLTSVRPNFALSAAIAISQQATSPTPPP